MKQTNERLCALAQKGDAAALDSLIDNNKSFIGKVANDLFRSMNLAQSGLNLEVPDLCGSCHPQRHDGHGTGCLCRF